MSESITTQSEQLLAAITTLEAQRSILGDAVVDASLGALREKLAALEAQLAVEAAHTPAEERRLITILFTDVVGSTSLAEKLDPEEWRRTIGQLHSTVGNLIAQHQGHVAQYLGDGLLAFFGAPTSSELDPENAIRAALEFQAAVASMDFPHKIQIRVGIHTGLVVVGELGADEHKEFTATGDAMNLAARLQSAAPPGGIIISHETYRYVRGVFDVTPQPPLAVKGKSELIQTYLVRRAKPRPFRTVMRGVMGLETRTIGRESELKQLQAAYLDAHENKRVVWAQLIGEPGVGKSRLLEDTREWIDLRPENVRLLRARAYMEDSKQPFALIRRMWFDRFQIAEDAPLAQAEAKWVQQFNELLGKDDVEAAHALGLLVGLPFEESPYIGAMHRNPAQVKGRAFVVSRDLLDAIRLQAPIELLLEDLHLADAASWDYLVDVVWKADQNERLNGIFVLGAARPVWKPLEGLLADREPSAVVQHRSPAVIYLAPLSDEATRELVRELLRKVENMPEDVVQMIVKRSEGVPYFAEEMVNYFLDRGIIDKSIEPWRFVVGRLHESPLPTTLQHLLLTRLSALNDAERSALQYGSIFGRNFWTGGVEALGARGSDELLTRLQPHGFVVAQPDSSFGGEQEWSFYHGLLRDVTYESVLKRERIALHNKAAEWLEAQARAANRLEEFAGLLGEHYERAGELKVAAEWFLQAGERAHTQGAPREAKYFFDRTLELLPPVERELRWGALLGREAALDRLGEREAQQTNLSALLELAELFDDDSRRAEAFYRQARYQFNLGEYRALLAPAEKSLAAARRSGYLSLEARALGDIIFSRTRLGETESARQLVEQALASARASDDEAALAETLRQVGNYHLEASDRIQAVQLLTEATAIAQRLGDRVLEVAVLENLGYTYALLGLYKLARPILEQSLRVAESIGELREHAYGLQNLGFTYFRSGDGRTARRLVEQSLIELTSVGDTFGEAACHMYLGHIDEQAGDFSGAARQLSVASKMAGGLGVRGFVVDCTAGLARCSLAQGQLEAARQFALEVWNHLSVQGPDGLELPTLCYQTCADIFDALGESENSRAAIEAGYRDLMARAEKISDAEWRKSFLDNVPEHRAIVELWERSSSTAKAQTINRHTHQN